LTKRGLESLNVPRTECLAEDLQEKLLEGILQRLLHRSAGDFTRSAAEYQAKPKAKLVLSNTG
jgi:hypothetical protein